MSDLPPKRRERKPESTRERALKRLQRHTSDEENAGGMSALATAATEADVEVEVDFAKARERVGQVLKFSSYEQPIKYCMDTGSKDLNNVLGSRMRGIPYGRMIELSGLEHGGKTLLGYILMAMAQRDGAICGYIDTEDSEDRMWMERLGINYEKVIMVKTKLVKAGESTEEKDGKKVKRKTKLKAGDPLRIEGAEELFSEAEGWMAALHEQGVPKQYWLVDSLANLVTVKQIEAGTDGQSMNTKVDVPVVLARTLPKWAGLASNYNAMVVWINQLRNKVGVFFGDPFDTPGGRAARHAFGNRTRVKRLKGGMLRQGQHVTGIVGELSNIKNKMGFGSVQSEHCGFTVSWAKEQLRYKFMTVNEAAAILKGE